MDWFERLMGFVEAGYESTQRQLEVRGDRLVSLVNGRSYGIGSFEMPSLGELRERTAGALPGSLKVSTVTGDVRKLHRESEFEGALFQVASQFNMLEMVGPSVTPEQGVTRYAGDHTQGPACAIAVGAATIYRNYLIPCQGGIGQTKDRQLDGLADVGEALAELTDSPVSGLWAMRNGYAMASPQGLRAIARALETATEDKIDRLRAKLRIGVHGKVEVTDAESEPRPVVSQAFCSALPVAYAGGDRDLWAPFASLVLEAAYEATLLTAVESARSGGSNVVLLTLLGGGAFGNEESWILGAMQRALLLHKDQELDVRIVCYGRASRGTEALVDRVKDDQ